MRFLLVLAAVLVGSCSEVCPEDARPAPPSVVEEPPGVAEVVPRIEDRYLPWLVGVYLAGDASLRYGSGVLVHDCPRHGVLVGTCWHVVDDDLDYSTSLWPHRECDRYPVEVIDHDADADVALLRLGNVPEIRIGREVPVLAPSVAGVRRYAAVVWRSGVPRLVEGILAGEMPGWFVAPDSDPAAFGDSGAPLLDRGRLVGLYARLNSMDHSNFSISYCADLVGMLRRIVVEDDD